MTAFGAGWQQAARRLRTGRNVGRDQDVTTAAIRALVPPLVPARERH
jgi:hypothetical protein